MSKRIVASLNDENGKINIALALDDISMIIVPENLIVMKSGHSVKCENQDVVRTIAAKFWQEYSNNTETTDFTGKPVPVSFDVYKDQWVKARLTYHTSRISAIKVGEVYTIRPYKSYSDKEAVAVRGDSIKGEKKYFWDDVQFELVDVKKGGEV